MTAPSEALQALHQQARTLLTQLHPLAVQAPGELQSTWADHLGRLEELVQFLASGGGTNPARARRVQDAVGRVWPPAPRQAHRRRLESRPAGAPSEAVGRHHQICRDRAAPTQPRHAHPPHRRC